MNKTITKTTDFSQYIQDDDSHIQEYQKYQEKLYTNEAIVPVFDDQIEQTTLDQTISKCIETALNSDDDKKLAKHHLAAIAKGITLDDGPAPVDSVSYIEGASHEQVGIEIHIGRNRIVRRIFESFGYQIMHLDRVVFGSLTKKDVKRGSWKSLDKKEVDLLRML